MQRFNDPVPTPSPPTANSFTPFSRAEDVDQLDFIRSEMRALIRDGIGSVEARTWDQYQWEVERLEGHQDIKDMFASLDGMEFIPSLRRMADILELIDTKLEDLERLEGHLEGVVASVDMSLDEIANADTDVEDDEPASPPLRRRLVFTSDDESDDEGVARRLRF